ncbi:MAG: hypothetical protein H6672_20265 [Anaerolineaceae bacterium]|nr:hypothetical protein [Anaerolineaceae bacterium]
MRISWSAVLHLTAQLPGLWQVRAKLRPLSDRRPRCVEVLQAEGRECWGQLCANFIVNAAFTSVMAYGSVTVRQTPSI